MDFCGINQDYYHDKLLGIAKLPGYISCAIEIIFYDSSTVDYETRAWTRLERVLGFAPMGPDFSHGNAEVGLYFLWCDGGQQFFGSVLIRLSPGAEGSLVEHQGSGPLIGGLPLLLEQGLSYGRDFRPSVVLRQKTQVSYPHLSAQIDVSFCGFESFVQ